MPSGPSTWIASPGSSAQSARVPGPIGSKRNASSPARRQAEAHRPRQHPARRLEHEELARHAGSSRPARARSERVRPDRSFAARTLEALASAARHASMPIRSCSESADSARAFAIAWTAAAAPAIVVMHGTRATSAASRIR